MLKRCRCGASYTLHDWLVHLPFVMRMPGFGGDPVEVRQCTKCHSSLGVDVGEMHCLELELANVQKVASDALFWARMRGDVHAERRALIWIALLDRAQGYDHRRWDHLRGLWNVRDYRRRMRNLGLGHRVEQLAQVHA